MATIEFNYVTRKIKIDGSAHKLTEIEFHLLWVLYLHAGEFVDYDSLLVFVWGTEYRGETKCLFDYIHLLRKKIEPDPKNPVYIVNVRNRGYRLNISPSA